MLTTAAFPALEGATSCFVDMEPARASASRFGGPPTGPGVPPAGGRADSSLRPTVVVGVADDDLDVVEVAARRAASLRATLLLVHARPGRSRARWPGLRDRMWRGGAGAEGRLSAAAAALRRAGIDASYECRAGGAAAVLVASAHANGAREILIGARRPAGPGRRTGRVARSLSRTATCPVILVG